MTGRRRGVLVAASALVTASLAAACSTSSDVVAGPVRPPLASTTAASPSTSSPATTAPPTTAPPTTVALPDGPDPVEPDPRRPSQPFDKVLAAELNDIQAYWTDAFPTVYGKPYSPLAGGIWAVFAGSQRVPGCGQPQTTYHDIRGNAFYCAEGDFVAFDDQELFPKIYAKFGPFILGMVLAHEWGHAVQQRAGVTDEPTILLEQQADCFAGAWMGHLQDGASPYLRATDSDLNSAFAGMVTFSDAPGTTADQQQAHGSGFDRVGAFQDGFINGPKACAAYPDKPPTVIELPLTTADQLTGGNMPYADMLPAASKDLDRFWGSVLAAKGQTYTTLAGGLRPFPSGGPYPSCGAVAVTADTVAYCPPQDAIVYDDGFLSGPVYEIGDFAVGVLIGNAWSAAMETRLHDRLSGKDRSLQGDCLTGAWAGDILTNPDQSRQFYLSAGDLDEGLTAFLRYGSKDAASSGTVFDRIASFRKGLLQGTASCGL